MLITEDLATRKCFNGTWQSVNQTLCGSKETAELKKIYVSATASSEDKKIDKFKNQVPNTISKYGLIWRKIEISQAM
jgi:hypothetical protein